LGALAAVSLVSACGRDRNVLVTYFDGEHGLSLRHPAGWRSDQAEQEGVFYRYFAPPRTGTAAAPLVSATLLVAADAFVEEWGRRYVSGQSVSATEDVERQGVRGRAWVFGSSNGTVRHRLLLLQDGARVVGLHAQGEEPAFEQHLTALERMASSLTLERPELYPERRWDDFGLRLRVPGSWRETRQFSGGGTLLVQFASPPLSAERSGETVHAAMTLTVEPVPDSDGLIGYYERTRSKLGENFLVVSHRDWQGGYVDVMRTETSLAVSYVKRFYRTADSRACSLSLDAREDVFPRASAWVDVIASSLRLSAPGEGRP